MTEKPRTPKDAHYARLRRAHRAATGKEAPPRRRLSEPGEAPPEGRLRLYGLHTVAAALANPRRRVHQFWATRNALDRLGLENTPDVPTEIVEPRFLDRLLGSEAVHQGVAIETDPLTPRPLGALGPASLILVLDQVTDPHNVGAILRSAVAFGASAVVSTTRHSPQEGGVLAKAASGALEHIDLIEVRNLADALQTLQNDGWQTLGLDSEGPHELEASLSGEKIALVLGAEGKGLRQKTRETVTTLARLDLPGPIRSLNVSNAAAVALYAARLYLGSVSQSP